MNHLQENSDIAVTFGVDSKLRSLHMAVIGNLSLDTVSMESLGK